MTDYNLLHACYLLWGGSAAFTLLTDVQELYWRRRMTRRAA